MNSALPADVRIEPAVRGLPRRLTFPDGAIFETEDADGFARVLAEVGASGAAARDRLSLPAWGLLILLAMATPFALWFGYTPAADAVARALPESIDHQIGQGVLSEMDGRLFAPSQLPEGRRAAVEALFDEIVAAAEVEPSRVRLLFRKSEALGANALALPDGTIVVLDGLITLSRDPDELAGVLAHEVAHVTERHALRKLVRATGITVLASLMLGETSGFIEEGIAAGLGLSQLAYSREFETEADAAAREILTRTGRDPAAMVALLRRILAGCGENCEEAGLLSTHPGLRERLETMTGAE
jgi:predicted Zn-dependent protease